MERLIFIFCACAFEVLMLIVRDLRKHRSQRKKTNVGIDIEDIFDDTASALKKTAASDITPPSAEAPSKRSAKDDKKANSSTIQTVKPASPPVKPEKPAVPVPVETEKHDFSEDGRRVVISVQHVTMVFHVATSNVSGLKDYVIQRIKKQVSFRELHALNDINFDVYKGEVVGIIGTNGSGKSTLLRIVSGALSPTSGQVVVNRRKLQLLTLGTGFDTELTAKENVYLNGSIIGYTKEFLDEHYNEIVEFAELQGFMDEKVKNFSSGMVSRLGFAIATAGGAAEILILDEILSVGDEFFRKKSLAKIKEMIHSGATVLMVSHSLNTIIENCTKVVWIEKGNLRMIGDPKTVCTAYRKMNKL